MRRQSRSFCVNEETFTEEIAPARTFGFLRDVERLRQQGLALGGSLENAIVIGENRILNHHLRFSDEFIRHKILDAVGDLALMGHRIQGHVVAHRAGHAMHIALVNTLLKQKDAYEVARAYVPGVEEFPALDLAGSEQYS